MTKASAQRHGMAMTSAWKGDGAAAEEQRRRKARERSRRYRERQRAGQVLLTVDVGDDLILWLIDHHWIGEEDRLDRAALEAAVSDVLFCLANKTLIANLDEVNA